VAPTGLAREPHAAVGLALPGFVVPVGVTGRGLTQQRTDRLPGLKVGVSSAAPLLQVGRTKGYFVVVIGVDPHKRTHTATAVQPGSNRVLATVQIEASLAGYRRLLRWARAFESRRWAVENARGLGRHLAQWLVARREQVEDVPSTATARVRELSRGGRRKNDVIDAAAAASVAALTGDVQTVEAEGATTLLALLDERRGNLVAQRTRLVNQLHALLRDLVPGGAPTDLTVPAASRLLATVRPIGPVEAVRKQLARDLVGEVREADRRLKTLTTRIAEAVADAGSRLPQVDGIGPVVAGRLLGRTRRASRFPTAAAFASYAGVAPIEVASGDRARHRLPRGGDRQLNLALHIAALTQVRMRGSTGRAYYEKKIAGGKTHNEAMRCLKRRLADHVWRIMRADERAAGAGPGGHSGATLTSSAAGPSPQASSSDKSLPGPAGSKATTGSEKAA
jgi:transposase